MKETLATSKTLHQLSAPLKMNFEVCPKISNYDGLQLVTQVSEFQEEGVERGQRGYGNRNFLLPPLHFLGTINLLFLKQQVYYYPVEFSYKYLECFVQKRKCTFFYTDTFCRRVYFLKSTLRKVYFQEKLKLHQLPTPFKVNFEVCLKVSQQQLYTLV